MEILICDDLEECNGYLTFPEGAVSIEIVGTEGEFYASTKYFELDFGNTIETLRFGDGPMNIEGKGGARYTIYNYKQKGPISFYIEYGFPQVSTPPLVPDGTLSSVVGGVGSVVGEFIPYVIYIGFGVLIASLGFVSIKWLLSYLYQKVKKTFRSK